MNKNEKAVIECKKGPLTEWRCLRFCCTDQPDRDITNNHRCQTFGNLV